MKTYYKHIDIYNIILCFSLLTTIGLSPLFNPGFQPAQHRFIISFLEIFTIFTFLMKGYTLRSFSDLPHYIKLVFALWCFISLLSILFSHSNISTATSRQAEWLIHLFFGWTIYSLLIQNSKIRSFIQSLPIFASLFVICGLLVFWFCNVSANEHNWSSPPFFVNIRHLTHLSVAALLLIPCVNKNNYLYTLPATLLLWTLLIWTGGRAGILAVIIAITITTFLNKNWLQIVIHLLAFFVGSHIAMFFPTVFSDIFLIVKQQSELMDLDSILSGRITIWLYSLKHLLYNPIFGAGIDGFYILSFKNNYNGLYHPHNLIIQFFLEWGIIGGSAFLILIVKSHTVIWKNRMLLIQDDLTTATFTMYIAFSLISLFSGIYYVSYSMLLLTVCNSLLFSKIVLHNESIAFKY